MADRATYPVKDANSEIDLIRKFFDSEANEIKDVLDNHANLIEALEANIILSENPFYGRWASLALLIQAYPVGEENAWAIIDAGAGITPQIVAWDDVGEEWEFVNTIGSFVQFYNNYASLPSPGVSNTLYITTDNFNTYVWYNSQYNQTNLLQVQNHRTFFIKEINTTTSDPGIGQIAFNVTAGKVTHVHFNSAYSNFIDRNITDLSAGNSIYFTVDNITQQNRCRFKVVSINTDENDYVVKVEETELSNNYALRDKVEVLFDYYKSTTSANIQRFTVSDSPQTEFILSDAPDDVMVTANRAAKVKDIDYTLQTNNASTKKVVFSSALAVGSRIEILKTY